MLIVSSRELKTTWLHAQKADARQKVLRSCQVRTHSAQRADASLKSSAFFCLFYLSRESGLEIRIKEKLAQFSELNAASKNKRYLERNVKVNRLGWVGLYVW